MRKLKTRGASQRFQFEAIAVDRHSPTPLFRQLENRLRESIWQGQLTPGERLPSTRKLAKQLQLGRNTVINAYEQLTVEGLLITEQGAGTRVTFAVHPPTKPLKKNKPQQSKKSDKFILASRYTQYSNTDVQTPKTELTASPFIANTPDIKAFPQKIWTRLASRRLRNTPSDWMRQQTPHGYFPLREAISSYLGADRGITAEAEQILVTSGTQQSLDLLAKLLIDPGDYVVFEEPGYTHAMLAFEMAGATIISIPVDEQGLDVKQLNKIKQKIKLIYVTPTCHFPLGMALSQARRNALLEWAEQNNSLILEDDYNGEYRYSGRPIATLYEQSESHRVIYLGSFSKLLFPSLRLGFMLVPDQLIQPLARLRWLLDRHSPPLEQIVLTDFINEGYLASHLRKMRILYSKRQQALLNAAKEHLPGILDIPALDCGLHLIGWLDTTVKEKDLLLAARLANIELTPVSLFCRLPVKHRSVVLGYAAYSEDQLIGSVKALKQAYDAKFLQ